MSPERKRSAVLRSGALRFAAVFSLVFAIAAILYVAGIHLAIRSYADSTLRSAIEGEIALLRGGTLSGPGSILQRAAGRPDVYFGVFAPDGRRIAGNLPAMAAREGWSTVAIYDAVANDEGEPVDVLSKGVRLDDGRLLVVGRSLSASGELVEWLDTTVLWSASGIVVLALVGGWIIASVFLQRLDRVSAAIDRIVAGAFAERLPAIGMGSEFDALATRVNVMLDKIIALMEGQRDLSSHLAHELRTPLARVHQRLEAALGLAEGQDLRGSLDIALQELEALRDTFSALLRLATIERGALKRRFGRIDLSALAENVVGLYEPAAEDRGKNIALNMDGPSEILGDADLLAQLLTNLLENALVHTGPGTKIVVFVGMRDGRAIVEVSDNGPGVSEAERSIVVQRFRRSASAAGTPGVGLGLALVDAIATLHGGRLTLMDARPGLRVVLSCPLAPPTGGPIA